MKNLTHFIDGKNMWREMAKKPLIDLKNAKDRQDVADSIACELSPENLHCDGEISHAQAMKKYKYLMAAFKELQSIDPKVTLRY